MDLIVIVTTPFGVIFHVHAKSSDSIAAFKNRIHQMDSSYKSDQFKLIYSGKILEDSKILVEYNIQNETTITLVGFTSALLLAFPRVEFDVKLIS